MTEPSDKLLDGAVHIEWLLRLTCQHAGSQKHLVLDDERGDVPLLLLLSQQCLSDRHHIRKLLFFVVHLSSRLSSALKFTLVAPTH